MALHALILAGSRQGAQDPLAKAHNVSHKALLPIAGQPMLARVVETLRNTPAIADITICIETEAPVTSLYGPAIPILPSAQGPSESIHRALTQLGAPLLVTTADHPLLQRTWIEDFLKNAGTADFAIGIATKATIERDVPKTRRTYIRLRDLQFSGCNLFLLRTPQAANIITLWRKIEHARKKPWTMAALLGPQILLRALTGTLTEHALIARVTKLAHGARPALIRIDDGWAAVDVDKESDFALAEKRLSRS